MSKKDNNSGCFILIIGIIIGTYIFDSIYTYEVWDRVLNAPVEAMAATKSISLWIALCLGCAWLIGKIWSYLNE
jgi:hypothetical protein